MVSPPAFVAFSKRLVLIAVTLVFAACLIYVSSVQSPTVIFQKTKRMFFITPFSKHDDLKNKTWGYDREREIWEVNQCRDFLSAVRAGRWVARPDVDPRHRREVKAFIRRLRLHVMHLPPEMQLPNKSCGENIQFSFT